MSDSESNQDNPIATISQGIDLVAPSGWRQKLAKASAQLLLGSQKGAEFYASARNKYDEIEGLSALDRQMYSLAAQDIAADREILEVYKARLLSNMFRENENMDAVIKGANKHLLALPEPTESVAGEESAPKENFSDDDPLDADWASTFVPLAKAADSEGLRERLSKILAGEIQRRGAFPRATLRSIWEMEKSDLEALSSVFPWIVGNWIRKEANMSLETTNHLLELGLIHEVGARTFTKKITASPDQAGGLTGQRYGLIVHPSKNFEFAFEGIPLTRLGIATLSLLADYDEISALRMFVESVPKDGVIYIVLGKFDVTGSATFQIREREVAYRAP